MMRKSCSFLGILRFATEQLQTLINGYVMRFIRVATAGCAKSYKIRLRPSEMIQRAAQRTAPVPKQDTPNYSEKLRYVLGVSAEKSYAFSVKLKITSAEKIYVFSVKVPKNAQSNAFLRNKKYHNSHKKA